MSTWEKVKEYFHNNITQNIKKLMATLGSMITTLIATLIFILKEGYSWQDGLIIILLAMQPFFYIYINIIFRGESELKEQQLLLLQRELDFSREIAEYRVLLAAKEGKVPEAILSNRAWNEINEKIRLIQEQINNL